jgi:hypothetical protein
MRVNCHKTVAATSALLLSVGIAGAAEVTLISVGGVKGALDKIVADYRLSSPRNRPTAKSLTLSCNRFPPWTITPSSAA